MQMYQSKIFANETRILRKPVREALGLESDEIVRYVISWCSVQVFKLRSTTELARMLASDNKALVSLEYMDHAIAQAE